MVKTQQHLADTVDPLVGSEWGAAVSEVPNASFFHGAVWAKILASTYGFLPLYLKTGEPGRIGLLPLMEVSSFITGRRGIALPFTDECEPIGDEQDRFNILYRSALCQLSARKWRYLELRGGSPEFSPIGTAAEFFGHEIQLSDTNPLSALGRCTKSVRGAIRKAEKNGVLVESSKSLEGMQSFYSLLCQTRKRHGNPPQPFKFFAAIHRNAIEGGSGLVLLAKYGGAVIAGAVFLHTGRSAVYKFAASDSAFQHLCGSNLVLWRGVEWYCERGFSRVQLGRTSLGNEGLRRFKSGWGSREYSIKYFRHATKDRQFVAGSDNSSGWQTCIFKILPLPVSRRLGAIAYRHIA
jgi:hypothetical protein